MDDASVALTQFLSANHAAVSWVAALLALAETTAFVSVLVPSTALLVAAGAAVATGFLPFVPLWAGAAAGALIGSTFSWWLGRRYGERILRLKLLRDNPALVTRTEALFARWGMLAVPAGHFIGPLRPVVFLLAGMSGMSFRRFQAVNVPGAMAWAFVVPATGIMGGDLFGWLRHFLGL